MHLHPSIGLHRLVAISEWHVLHRAVLPVTVRRSYFLRERSNLDRRPISRALELMRAQTYKKALGRYTHRLFYANLRQFYICRWHQIKLPGTLGPDARNKWCIQLAPCSHCSQTAEATAAQFRLGTLDGFATSSQLVRKTKNHSIVIADKFCITRCVRLW